METRQQGLFEGADKLLEALSKLTDSLSKAPMPVVALIGAVLFLLIAVGGSALECAACATKQPGTNARAGVTPIELCVVGYFADADHHLPVSIHDTPSGCLNRIAGVLREGKSNLVLVIGRCDARELNAPARRHYTENLSLAYQRAEAVQEFLLAGSKQEISSTLVLLAAGAAHVGSTLSAETLRQDRSALTGGADRDGDFLEGYKPATR
jgi:hypothetical protein